MPKKLLLFTLLLPCLIIQRAGGQETCSPVFSDASLTELYGVARPSISDSLLMPGTRQHLQKPTEVLVTSFLNDFKTYLSYTGKNDEQSRAQAEDLRAKLLADYFLDAEVPAYDQLSIFWYGGVPRRVGIRSFLYLLQDERLSQARLEAQTDKLAVCPDICFFTAEKYFIIRVNVPLQLHFTSRDGRTHTVEDPAFQLSIVTSKSTADALNTAQLRIARMGTGSLCFCRNLPEAVLQSRTDSTALASFDYGLSQLRSDNEVAAKRAFQAVIDSLPESPEPYYNLALLHLGENELVLAQHGLARFDSLHTGASTGAFLNNMGYIAYKQGEDQTAKTYFERAVRLSDPDAAQNLDLLSSFQGYTGKLRELIQRDASFCQRFREFRGCVSDKADSPCKRLLKDSYKSLRKDLKEKKKQNKLTSSEYKTLKTEIKKLWKKR